MIKNNTYMPSIEDYSKSVTDLANSRSDFVFDNYGVEHACIVFDNIFKSAKKEISIYAESLNSVLTNIDKYQKSLLDAIDRNVKVSIKLNNFDSSLPFIDRLLKKGVKIKKAKNVLQDGKGSRINFTFADNSIYRFEYDVESFKAYCCFNSQDDVKILRSHFSNL